MELEFTKMHGAGNDFIFLDCLKHDIDHLDAIALPGKPQRAGALSPVATAPIGTNSDGYPGLPKISSSPAKG